MQWLLIWRSIQYIWYLKKNVALTLSEAGGPLEGSFLPLLAPVAPGALGLWPRPSNLCPHLYTASLCVLLSSVVSRKKSVIGFRT